ncbi:DUF2243 domain-containing protein [Streptomyces sp. NPDC004096]
MATAAGPAWALATAPSSLQLPGIVLGVGLGGFVDGILLHQLLQWHHMLSSTNHDRIGVNYSLYNTASSHPVGHWLMHAHFLASGCLLAHAIAGPDPAPARPAVRARLVYLGAAITTHALIAQAMYGGIFVDIHAPISQVQQGAEIMYYGGDIAELLLAATLITTWRPERRAKTATTTRNPAVGTPAPQ